jgi:hypothetical protein
MENTTQNRVIIDLMGIHSKPTEKITTPLSSSSTSDNHWSTFLPKTQTLEQSSIDLSQTSQLLPTSTDLHLLLTTIDTSFNEHRPLSLTPDDLLLPLIQSVANYIDEKLTNKTPILNITPGKEKVKLVVRRDDFALGRKDNPWNEIFSTFGEMIKNDIGEENYRMLRGEFSTSGVYQRAGYDVSLMSACKSHYEYHNMFLCGIPEIHLMGTDEDWKSFKEKAVKIAEFMEVPGWKVALGSVIDQIIKSRQDPSKENIEFWCNLYRRGHHSGGEHINGWINLFFPYIRNHDKLTIAKDNENMMGKGMFGGRNVGSYPSSISWAPVECNDRGNKVQLTYHAGQIGVKWDTQDMSLSPAWGWCISINQK